MSLFPADPLPLPHRRPRPLPLWAARWPAWVQTALLPISILALLAPPNTNGSSGRTPARRGTKTEWTSGASRTGRNSPSTRRTRRSEPGELKMLPHSNCFQESDTHVLPYCLISSVKAIVNLKQDQLHVRRQVVTTAGCK